MKLFDKLSGKEFEVSTSLGNTFLKHNHIKNGGRYCLPKEVVKYTDLLGLEEVEENDQLATLDKAKKVLGENLLEAESESGIAKQISAKDLSDGIERILDEAAEPDISAAARKLAENNGIDWRKAKGSGKDGMIVKSDINDLI